MRIILYVRVSTQEQAKEGYSIEEQIDRLKKFCDAHGWIVVNIYTDAGYSGGNTDRPALQDLIKDVKAGKADKIVVYKLDRLSRSQKDTLELIEDVFLKNNVDFVSMSENFDTSTPFGRAMIGILAVFAQLEREQIKERMAMGREGRAKEGKYFGGGKCPIGYDYVNGELVVNEYEAMQVKEIFDTYLTGVSIREIERVFISKGYSHKHGIWTNGTIGDAIMNELYIGNVSFQGQKYKGIHEPLITQEQFDACNKLKEQRKNTNNTNWSRTSILGGLMFCKKCGARYAKNTVISNGKKYNYYACYTRRAQSVMMMRGSSCKNKTWNMQKLNDLVLGEIRKLAIDPEYIVEIKEANNSIDEDKRISLIKKEISNINAERSRFMKLYGSGKFSMEELEAEIDELNDKREKLEAQLAELTGDKSEMTVEAVQEIVSDFAGIIDRGDVHEQIQLVNSLIDRIEIDNEDVYIHWKFA